MTKSQERKLNNAIFQLKRYYECAIGNGHIKHPLAWALYQTWQDEDIKSRTTKGKKWKVTFYCTECVKMNTDGCPYHTSTPDGKACDDFLYQKELEVWNGIHGQTIMPKGTFERIYNDAEEEDDDI
jgi:hypothetical protein